MKSMTHADYLALRRFPALDGLRAIAAVMVVFFHYGSPDWQVLVAIGFAALHVSLKPVAAFLNGFNGIQGHVLVIPGYAPATALLLAALVAPGPATTFLSAKPMRFVGERSYSLYLVQTIAATVIWFCRPSSTGLGQAVALASVLHRTVEVPLIDPGRRVIARQRAKAQQGAPQAPTPQSESSRLATIGQAQP